MYERERNYDPDKWAILCNRVSREYGYRKKDNVMNPEYVPPAPPPPKPA